MFPRVRQLHISLARKCQLLFGAAAILIIGAALLVPWRRVEQLTDQLNERAAYAVTQTVLAQHMERHAAAENLPVLDSDSVPSDPAPMPQQSDIPIEIESLPADPEQVRGYTPPRLIGLQTLETRPETLTPFERSALRRFAAQPDRGVFARLYDNGNGYRYAQAVFATQQCIDCHAGDANLALSAGAAPATQPMARNAPLIGMVSIDMPSQLHPNQLLLNRVLILTAGAIPGFLAVVILTLIISRLILRPVRVLQECAEKVSEGDLNIRSDISSGDEFQQLSETFNTMLVNLKTSADQLRAVNKSLDLKLGQLAESNVALYESNRLKSEFLANVSHELRTPLNSILGFADLLRDVSSETDPKMTRYIQNILRSGNHLLDLINDLLDLAKIEAGRMEVRSEPLSIADVFEGLASLLKPMLEAKSLRILSRVEPGVPILQTDPAKLQQMLYNFLSNAIKFSPVGESIELVAERDGEQTVRISVVDRGPGIAPEKQAVIFEKFRQIDGSVTREHGGTGLGLAISKELATLLGGSIGVSSTPGDGATFWIILPLKIEPGPQDVRGALVLS